MAKLYASLITLSLIWGTSFLFIKILLDDIGAWGVVFGRCLFGVITLITILIIRKEKISWKTLPYLSIILVGLLNNAIPWTLISISETKISSSMASVINATTPLWTILIGFFMFSNRLKLKQWIGVVIGFFGILLLLNLNPTKLFEESLLGMGTMIGAAMCYGIGTQLSKKYLKSLSIIQISASTLVVSTIISYIFMVTKQKQLYLPIYSFQTFVSLIGLGVFGSGIAYLLFYYMVKEGSPEFAAFVTYLVPITAMLWGKIWLQEAISSNMVGGLFFIFVGVYLSSYKRKNKSLQEQKKVIAT
ncbi:DMT family transporter [Bacillus timonensis]|nr:DMT family transporter [Bacillus timonensis]